MKLIQTKVNFPYESYIVVDEPGVEIIFGLDRRSNVTPSFQVNINNKILITQLLQYYFRCSTYFNPTYLKNDSNYRLWKDERMLEILKQTFHEDENKPEHMQEDIDELYERRENLTQRIDRQLKATKSQLNGLIQAQLNQETVINSSILNQLLFSEDLLAFENYNFQTNVYLRIEIHGNNFQTIDKFIDGAALLEINFNNLMLTLARNQIIDHDKTLIFRSSELDSKKIVSRRGSSSSIKAIRIPRKHIENYNLLSFTTILFSNISDKIVPKELVLSRSQIFDLLMLIKNNLSDRSKFQLKIRRSLTGQTHFRFERTDKSIWLHIESENTGEFNFNELPTSVFRYLGELSSSFEKLVIKYYSSILPISFEFSLEKSTKLLLIYQSPQSKLNQLTLKTMISNMSRIDDTTIIAEVLDYFLATRVVGHSEFKFVYGNKYSQEFAELLLFNLVSKGVVLFDTINQKLRLKQSLGNHETLDFELVRKASTIVSKLKDYIVKTESENGIKYEFTDFPFISRVEVDETQKINNHCSCHLFSKKSLCEHILALASVLLIEGKL